MSDPRADDEVPISLDAPKPEWARRPLPDITTHEEEVQLPGGTAERLYIPSTTPWTIGRDLFLRGVGVVQLIAFVSLAVQARGLFGSQGIAPIAQRSEVLRSLDIGWGSFPSIFRIIPSLQAQPDLVAWIGAVCALAMVIGVAPPLVACATWLLYLSFVTMGDPFLSFQWDALLLETSVLALLMSPWSLTLRAGRRRPVAAPLRWCAWFLIARLMLLSVMVKLASGSEPWRDGTALDYHWWTQPLPNPMSWWFAQMPLWIDRVLTFGSLGIELAIPILIVCGRRARALAAALVIALQIGIASTGNYGFFNLLTIVLALPLIDDEFLRRLLRRPLNAPMPIMESRLTMAVRGVGVTIAVLIALLVATPASIAWVQRVGRSQAGPFDGLPAWMAAVVRVPYEWGSRWRLASGYGLFADMTTQRPEIIIEASRDGATWEPYVFRWKPGALDRRPPVIPLHMPRLDWQMWFAALAWPAAELWQASLHQALMEARPDVLDLFERAPLGSERPRAVRWRRDGFQFSTIGSSTAQQGDWWIVIERGRPVYGFGRR